MKDSISKTQISDHQPASTLSTQVEPKAYSQELPDWFFRFTAISILRNLGWTSAIQAQRSRTKIGDQQSSPNQGNIFHEIIFLHFLHFRISDCPEIVHDQGHGNKKQDD